MNVHRRNRAHLRQTPPPPAAVIMNSSYHQELVANGGVCLIYSLPNPNAVFSPYTTNFMLPKCPPPSSSSLTEHSTSTVNHINDCLINYYNKNYGESKLI